QSRMPGWTLRDARSQAALRQCMARNFGDSRGAAMPSPSRPWAGLVKIHARITDFSSRVSSLGVIMLLRDRVGRGPKTCLAEARFWRRRIAPTVVLALSVAVAASAQAPKLAARYSATMAELTTGAGVAISLDVLRWSTDEDAEKLVAAFKDKSDK